MNNYLPEIEFKFFPENISEVLKNLEKYGTKTKERTLMKAINCRREDNTTFEGLDSLRLRDEGNEVKITLKQWFDKDERMEHVMEKEFTVSDFDVCAELFRHLGLFFSVESEKYRTTWEVDECEVVLDENPWLEPYFEIEGPDKETIERVCHLVSCNWESRRDVGARVLYGEKYGEEARNVRTITFATNPFIV